MRKVLMLLLMVIITSSGIIYANNDVNVVIPEFDVTVNNHIIDTEHSKYPVIRYKGIVYFPMTWDYLSGIGLMLKWDNETGLEINSTGRVSTFNESFLDSINVLGSKRVASIPNYQIKVNGNIIDNSVEEYPVLSMNNITYFPMTWRFAVTEFGWKTKWNNDTGFGIVTGNISITKQEDVNDSSIKALDPTEIGLLANSVSKSEINGIDDSNFETKAFDNGDSYYGEMLDGLFNGVGIYTTYDGAYYSGNFMLGKRHGYGEYYWVGGDNYVGNWENNAMMGFGVYSYSHGDVYTGENNQGAAHGYGVYTYSDGSKYSGFYKNKNAHGFGVYIGSNGYSFKGNYFDSVIDSYGIEKFPNGDTYQGMFYLGEFHGNGIYTSYDGNTLSGSFMNGEHFSSSYNLVNSAAAFETYVNSSNVKLGLDNLFTLGNGQTWKQISNEIQTIYTTYPNATLYRSGDEFMLNISNANYVIDVIRVDK